MFFIARWLINLIEGKEEKPKNETISRMIKRKQKKRKKYE